MRKPNKSRSRPNRRESHEAIGEAEGTTAAEEERTANLYKSARRSQKSPRNLSQLLQPRIQSLKKLRHLPHQRRNQLLRKNLRAVPGQTRMMKEMRKRMMSGSQ